VLDDRLPRDRQPIGETRRRELAVDAQVPEHPAPHRIRQRREDATRRILVGGARARSFLAQAALCSARAFSPAISSAQPPVLSSSALRRRSSLPASPPNPLSTTRSRVVPPSSTRVNSMSVELSSRMASPGNALAQR